MLLIDERTIRRHVPGHALAVLWRQWRAERELARRGVHFRTTSAEQIAAAYAAMSPAEFAAVNGRQDWANWRTIPRCLSGQVPDRPLAVVDLGCGAGSSTRVLAWYCPAGSHIIGYELASSLVDIARCGSYRHHTGAEVRVEFVCQGVTEMLRQANGEPLPDRSVDMVNASGVVGHHLSAQTIQPLVNELRRTLAHGGIAMLDVGPTLRLDELTRILTAASFSFQGHHKSWFGDPTGQAVYRYRDEC